MVVVEIRFCLGWGFAGVGIIVGVLRFNLGFMLFFFVMIGLGRIKSSLSLLGLRFVMRSGIDWV